MRANGADTVYMSFRAMLKDFTREDLIELYRTMFDPPLNEDAIWRLPLQQKMYCTKALTTPEQKATGKEISNPLIADSLLKTISCKEKTKTKRQNKDQDGLSESGKSPSKSSKADKSVHAEETVHDVEMEVGESIEEDVV
ncbi:hypothetical protein Tco_1445254, partial [Tanacetum coccineum]